MRGAMLRLLSILTVLVVVGSVLLMGPTAASAPAQSPAEEPHETSDVRPDVPVPRSPSRTPMSLEEIRAWAAKLDLPRASLAYAGEDRAPAFFALEGGSAMVPDDADEVGIHQADAVHALGFDGTDVRVAVIDTGVDFVHPDLFNATFRDPGPLSPWYLHPVVYDGASLNDYLLFGRPSPTSWWVDTSYSTSVVGGPDATAWVNWTSGNTTLSWNVTGVTGLGLGEGVRIGFHPDEKILAYRGNRSGLLLFNHSGAGAPYDHVLVDLDGDFSFAGEKHSYFNAGWATFDPAAELISRDLTGDGRADISGGILAFIADGVREIPYARRQIDVLNLYFRAALNDDAFDIWTFLGVDPYLNLVPGAGDLVAVFGDFEPPGSGGSHGTWVASAIAGQGLTGGGSGGPVLRGMAPGAKIIGSGNNFGNTDPFGQVGLYTALVFAVEGYDGVVGTGDEAHIASNSWGGADWAGWGWSSRWADWVSAFLGAGGTSFVFAAGNSGPGYGGRQGPGGGSSLIVSGAMENFNYRVDPWYALDGGPNPAWGDVTGFSNRGPSALGRHMVDAITSGHFGYGADPLNQNPFDADSGTALNGNSSWNLWAGTSLSTPNLAGVLALAYDAYLAAHGAPPSAEYAKRMLKAGADDAHVDPFLAGAGVANALRSALIANETDGLTLSVDEWNPGDYRGTAHPAYANLLPAGSSDVISVGVTSHRAVVPTLVTVEDGVLVKTGSLSYDFSKPVGSSWEYLLTPAGLRSTAGTVLVPEPGGLYSTSDAIRVSMRFPRIRMAERPYWLLDVYDWTDVNGNGSYQGAPERNLLFRDTLSYPDLFGPAILGWISDPANRTHDGLVLRLGVQSDAGLMGPVNVTLQVEYFARADSPWLTAAPTSFGIPSGATLPVTLTATVPADADPGLFEAVVLFRSDDGSVTTLPVVINVPIPAVPGVFGGDAYDAGGYRQGVQYGLAWDGDPGSGDYRYYFLDRPAPARHTVLVTWDESTSGNELYILTNGTDWFSEHEPLWFGPGTQAPAASSIPAVGRGASATVDFPEGLSVIVVRGTHNSGVSLEEHPLGSLGSIVVTPDPWVGAGVDVDGVQAIEVSPDIDLDGLVASGFGFSPRRTYVDVPVVTGDAHTYAFAVRDGGRIAVALAGTAGDLDLYLDRYDPASGAWISVASSLTPYATESVDVLLPPDGDWRVRVYGFSVPANTTYNLTIVSPQGREGLVPTFVPSSIPAGATDAVVVAYSLPHLPTILDGLLFIGTADAPGFLTVPAALVPDLPPEFAGMDPAPGSVITDPTPTVSVALRDAPDPYETAVEPDSVRLWLDGVELTSVARINASAAVLESPFVLADGDHTVAVSAADANGNRNATSWSFSIDSTPPSLTVTSPTVALTTAGTILVAGTTDVDANVTVNGVPAAVDPNGSFNATVILAEGPNPIAVVATDPAGNEATFVTTVTRDSTPPALVVSAPANNAVLRSGVVAVSGTSEAGADLNVNGIRVVVGPGGAWDVNLVFADGTHAITVTAMDAAGNTASVMRTVTVDTVAPRVTITAPTAALTNNRTVVVAGIVDDPSAGVAVNGVPASVNPATGVWASTVTFPADGLWPIAVTATDAAGNSGSVLTGILVDATAPVVTVSLPLDGTETDRASIAVAGTVDDATATVLVGALQVRPGSGGAWSVVVALDEGANTITVTAVDAAGNRAAAVSRTVTYTSPVPDIETGLTGNTQAINSLAGNVTLGLLLVFVALAVLQSFLYRNLRKKLEAVGTPEEPAGEDKGEA